MRDLVIRAILEAAKKNRSILFLSSDFGAPALDEFRRDLPEQFFNVGIAEQNMIDTAAGLTLSDKTVFCYAMAPFLTARCYEQIKCSLSSMALPVTLIGVGVGLGYDHVSMTHLAVEDLAIMRAVKHLEIWTPSDGPSCRAMIDRLLEKPRFCYLRLERTQNPLSDLSRVEVFPEHGLSLVKPVESGILLVASGSMVHVAMAAAHNWGHGVLDVQKIRPFYHIHFGDILLGEQPELMIVIEEHVRSGGLGELIAGSIADQNLGVTFCRLCIPDDYSLVHGDRSTLRKHFGIDEIAVYEAIRESPAAKIAAANLRIH